MPKETPVGTDALLRWHGVRPTPQRMTCPSRAGDVGRHLSVTTAVFED